MLKVINLWLFGAILVHTKLSMGSEDFCYYEKASCGPSEWTGMCNVGTHQSPMELRYNPKSRRGVRSADLYQNADYFETKNFNLLNNGHTVQASIQLDLTSKSTLTGSLLGGTYVFSQLHFHWGAKDNVGSEHVLNRKRYPMEVHLVHYSSEFNSLGDAIASNQSNAVAVFGTLYEIGNTENRALTPIIEHFDQVKSAKSNATGQALNLSWFLPNLEEEEVATILQYNGSLTTPSCAEVVLWNVFTEPTILTRQQLNAFRKLQSGHGGKLVDNFRPLQATHRRPVITVRTSVFN